MGHALDIVIGLCGLALVVTVFSDVFQSIIVPHYTPKGTRLSPRFISKVLWRPFRALVKAVPDNGALQGNLTMFAPGGDDVADFLLADFDDLWLRPYNLGRKKSD